MLAGRTDGRASGWGWRAKERMTDGGKDGWDRGRDTQRAGGMQRGVKGQQVPQQVGRRTEWCEGEGHLCRWVDGRGDGHTDEWWVAGWTDAQMHGRAGWVDGWEDGRTDGPVSGRTDGWVDRRIDRQTQGRVGGRKEGGVGCTGCRDGLMLCR